MRKSIAKPNTMKTIFISLFMWTVAVTTALSQTVLYINSNNETQAGTPTKSFQFVKQVFLKPGFYVNGSSGAWSATAYSANNNPQNYDKNFVRTETLLTNLTDESALTTLPVESKSTSYNYTDGFNRSLQSIILQGSQSKQDIVQFNVYDSYGHQPNGYLDYAIKNRGGAFRPAPISEQASFYQSSPNVAVDSEPYTINGYDNSPLDVVIKSNRSGQNWHGPDKARSAFESKVNQDGEVKQWIYDGSALPITSNAFPKGTLTISESTDEQGFIHRVYKNFKGQVILDRKGDGTTWFDTYSIYDWIGKLRYVFPPEASSRIASEYMLQGADQQGFLDRWCFQYKYDNYQRMTDKKVPGADWLYYIYDPWDRLVLTQNGNQRSSNQWTFTKYDIFNRPIITGITTGLRSSLQTGAGNSSNIRYEVRANSSVGYTNQSYPSASESDMLTITYYDDYAFKSYSGWDAEGHAFDFVNETASGQQGGFPQSGTDLFTNVLGQATGSKVKVINGTSSVWLNSVVYYDHKYRTIQTISENLLGGLDRSTNLLSFAGLVKQTLQSHTGTANITILKELYYDHAGRLLQTWQTSDGGTRTLLVSNNYNEAGQIIERNLHSTDGVNFLQSVDYRYTINGWLSSINNSILANDGSTNNDTNDLFGMTINYQQTQSIAGTNTTPLYNGNISSIRWATNNLVDNPQEKIYGYQYDVLSRLKNATYAGNTGSGFTSSPNAYNESMTYDNNGNIKTLNRNMIIGGVVQAIDQLDYKYGTNSPNFDNKGNVLTYLDDNSNYFDARQNNPDFGFTENTKRVNMGSVTEYAYDANGNLTVDYNKGITGSNGITYDSRLNLPLVIPMQNGGTITYTYDAVGNKLRKVVQQPGYSSVTTDYAGNAQFQNNQLVALATDAGRAVYNGSGYDYEYYLKDHLGNVRVVFGLEKETYSYKATLEPERNNKELQNFKNVNGTIGPNTTSKNYETPNPSYSAALNGSVGPATVLTVGNGDKITISANANYNQAVSSGLATGAALATAVSNAFGFVTGEAAQLAMNNNLPGALATFNANTNAPKAFLFYYLFSPDFTTWSQFGVAKVSTDASIGFEHLTLQVPISLPNGVTQAYMYIYAANQTTGTTVYFDDVAIVQEKNNYKLQVNQTNDYYPFGLTISPLSYQKQLPSLAQNKNKYQLQGQEKQEELGLGWYQFKSRMFDPAIGKFSAIDPLAENSPSESDYGYLGGNPVTRIDPDGKAYMDYNLELLIGSELRAYNNQAQNQYSRNLVFDAQASGFLRGTPTTSMAYNSSYSLYGSEAQEWQRNLNHLEGNYYAGPRSMLEDMGPTSQVINAVVMLSPIGAVSGVGMGLMDLRKGNYGSAALNFGGSLSELGSYYSLARSFKRTISIASQLVDDVNVRNKYAFGLKDMVPNFAESIGAEHLMQVSDWKGAFMRIANDSESEIHFLLDGIDSRPMEMILDPSRSGINWEMNYLYSQPTFENTNFYFGGNTYVGYDVFQINPYHY